MYEDLSQPRNHCASISPSSLWQIDTATTIGMTVDTSQCNFKETPLYFVSVTGSMNQICLIGYGAIYQPTKSSFQIYSKSICNGSNVTTMLSDASTYTWNVNWMGFYKY